MKKLLAIFAHPDDESFGPGGGTLAKYASEGVAVHYLCATRGEAGTVEDQFLENFSDIAELRTDEVQRAARELGLERVYFLGYRDSGMPGAADNFHEYSLWRAPLDEVAWKIARYLQHLQPDAVITHDPYGWYGHPDHVKCYQATLRAYELLYGLSLNGNEAARQPGENNDPKPPRLYASTFPKWLVRLTVRVLPLVGRDPRRHGQNRDIDLTQIASWHVPITARIGVSPYLNIKERALACHASQRPLTRTANPLFRWLLKRTETTETYCRLYPPVADREPVEADLFAAPETPQWNKVLGVWRLIGARRRVYTAPR